MTEARSKRRILPLIFIVKWKKKPEKIKASTGFEPVTSAIPVRCSEAEYEAIQWERGQFIEFILPWGVKWYEVYMK